MDPIQVVERLVNEVAKDHLNGRGSYRIDRAVVDAAAVAFFKRDREALFELGRTFNPLQREVVWQLREELDRQDRVQEKTKKANEDEPPSWMRSS